MDLYVFWLCAALSVAAFAMIWLHFVVDEVQMTERSVFDAYLAVYAGFWGGIIMAHVCAWELFGRTFKGWLEASIPQPGTGVHELLVSVGLAVSALTATFIYLVAIAVSGIALKRMKLGRPGLQE